MFHQIRTRLSDGEMQREGPTVELDETYVCGVRKYGRGRPMRGDKKETPVVAVVPRGGKVIAKTILHVTEPTLSGKRA
jgi:hypothetical protein